MAPRRLFLLFGLLLSPRLEAASPVLTLQEAYEKALIQSESLAIQEESLKIAEAHYLQALGTALPHLNVTATELIQDTSSAAAAGAGAVGTTFTRRSRPEVAITLSQPLFQGFRAIRSLKLAGLEKRRNQYLIERARQILFGDVARAYYTVLELERELTLHEQIKGTLLKRIQDIAHRLRIGKSRENELMTTEADLAQSVAAADHARGLVLTARDYLEFLLGEEVRDRLVDSFPLPSRIGSLESWLERLEDRPDRKASEESVQLARGKLAYEKGGRYPTIDLDANYYPYRVGFQSDIQWDLGFTMNVPIFQGGAVRGMIREAASLLRQTELQDREDRRRAEMEVRQSYHSVGAALKEEASLRRTARKSAESYKNNEEEYLLGLVNNLDLLQSLHVWQETRIAANLAFFQAKLQYLQLRLAAGDLKVGPSQ